MMSPKEALERVVEIAGGQAAFARALGGKVKQQHVYYWLAKGQLPAEYCLAAEKISKREVMRYDLRPDVYPGKHNRRVHEPQPSDE